MICRLGTCREIFAGYPTGILCTAPAKIRTTSPISGPPTSRGGAEVSSQLSDRLFCDPLGNGNNSDIVKVLGNIARPGFVILSSVSDPVVSPLSEEA